MRVAILCPGPSLPRTWDGVADVVVCVNRAVLFRPPDWFCAGDIGTLQVLRIRPRIGFCSSDEAIRLLGDELPPDLVRIPWSAFDLPNRIPECNYSVVTAVALAAHIGGTSIRLYGADMAGTRDYDGTEGVSRTEVRWNKERAELSHIVASVTRAGVQFDRIT